MYLDLRPSEKGLVKASVGLVELLYELESRRASHVSTIQYQVRAY